MQYAGAADRPHVHWAGPIGPSYTPPVPKIVDHEARRRDVAAVAARLVALGGIDAVTIRDVAAESGTSTAIVSHYFADKRELLVFSLAEAARRTRLRTMEAIADDPGNVAGFCEAVLPLDEERRRDWLVFVAFWGPAGSDPELAADHRRRTRDTRARLAEVVRAGDPSLSPVEADERARRMLMITTGISTQAVFDPEEWSPARQRRTLREELAK